jgi:plasmid stabilization system protein ParE
MFQQLMRIRWTVPPAEDLESIKNYLDRHYPHFSQLTIRAIYGRVRSLKTTPGSGSFTANCRDGPYPHIAHYGSMGL